MWWVVTHLLQGPCGSCCERPCAGRWCRPLFGNPNALLRSSALWWVPHIPPAVLPVLEDILRESRQTVKKRNASIIQIWRKVRGTFRNSVFGQLFWLPASLHSSTPQTTGHPTGKSPPRLDNYLHKLEEISRTRNPGLASTQMAHFSKSKIILRWNRGEWQPERSPAHSHTSCVWIVEVWVQAFIQEPWNLFDVPLLHMLHKLLQICLMEGDGGEGDGGKQRERQWLGDVRLWRGGVK